MGISDNIHIESYLYPKISQYHEIFDLKNTFIINLINGNIIYGDKMYEIPMKNGKIDGTFINYYNEEVFYSQGMLKKTISTRQDIIVI